MRSTGANRSKAIAYQGRLTLHASRERSPDVVALDAALPLCDGRRGRRPWGGFNETAVRVHPSCSLCIRVSPGLLPSGRDARHRVSARTEPACGRVCDKARDSNAASDPRLASCALRRRTRARLLPDVGLARLGRTRARARRPDVGWRGIVPRSEHGHRQYAVLLPRCRRREPARHRKRLAGMAPCVRSEQARGWPTGSFGNGHAEPLPRPRRLSA